MDEDVVQTFGTPGMMNKEDGLYSPGGDSTGKAMASKSKKEKEIPRYLRASTGSCHDLCKYGKRHIAVEKPWRSTAKKTFKKALDDDLNESSKVGSSKMKNKVMVAKKKTVSDDSSEVNKREVVKHQVSGVSNEIKKPEVVIISAGDETPVKQMKKKTTLSSKLKPSPDLGSCSSGTVDALKPKVLKKSYSALATSKSKLNQEQVASPVLKTKMGKISGAKDEDTKIKKTTASSRVVSKKVPVTPRASLSPRLLVRRAGNSGLRKSQSSKAVSSSPSQQNVKPRHVNRTDESSKQLDGYPVEEKTLHVVEMETTSKSVSENDQNQQCPIEPFIPPLPPTQSTQKDDECTVSETEEYEYTSESNEAESVDVDGVSNGEKKPRETRKESDSADEAARKLSFRRGKIVDADTVRESARKLKFRQGKGLGEDKAQDARRLSFKKREEIAEEEVDENGEKVVLRHQDVQEKDAQGLFNNVIEETASKLVEARKSKVKALVGAFETVISLQ